MRRVSVRHKTRYDFGGAVLLNPHRLMLRPREDGAIRLATFDLTIRPQPTIDWSHDVFGNMVAVATFAESSGSLDIEMVAELETSVAEWPVFAIAASALSYPFAYSADELLDLGALAVGNPGGDDRVRDWARGFVAGPPTDTLSLLKDLNFGVGGSTLYRVREEQGTQPPEQTLALGSGSCRDLAALFVEAARCLGFGARIVSGYLLDDPHEGPGLIGHGLGNGSTHAWAEVFLPGAGWIVFDPTNGKMGGSHLLPVAVARHMDQLIPIAGSFSGSSAATTMTVEVVVTALDAA